VVVVGDLILDDTSGRDRTDFSGGAGAGSAASPRGARAGGAANVARNLASLGALVSAAGVVGTDTAATALLDSLDEAGIDRGACCSKRAGQPRANAG